MRCAGRPPPLVSFGLPCRFWHCLMRARGSMDRSMDRQVMCLPLAARSNVPAPTRNVALGNPRQIHRLHCPHPSLTTSPRDTTQQHAQEAADLMWQCLSEDAAARPTAQQVMQRLAAMQHMPRSALTSPESSAVLPPME